MIQFSKNGLFTSKKYEGFYFPASSVSCGGRVFEDYWSYHSAIERQERWGERLWQWWKTWENLYKFFFWVENSSFFFGAFCLLSELNGDVVTWKKCKGGSAKGILQKGLEFNFQELSFSQTDGWNCIVS